jgi:phospholipase/lecithinase/hemolysin
MVEVVIFAPQRLVTDGAIYVVVSGNPPNGCSPALLTIRSSLNQTEKYDHLGCLSDINRVAMYHNIMLRAAVGALRDKYPHAKIIFADFYKPIISILQNPDHFGKNNSR